MGPGSSRLCRAPQLLIKEADEHAAFQMLSTRIHDSTTPDSLDMGKEVPK